MIQKFIEANYEIVEFDKIADIYVVNTCTVTNISDKKSRQLLRKVKKQNSNAIVVATGCYAQVAKKEIEEIPEIDLVLGNSEKVEIVSYVEAYNNKEMILEIDGNTIPNISKDKMSNTSNDKISNINKEQEFKDFGSVIYTENTRAVIKIQDGCDRFCTYCIIPYARGRVRSRNKESILNEIKETVKKGIKEIIITGIHIASYGKDFDNNYSLINLLEDINNIQDLKRIRLGSLEPTIITEEFVNKLKKLDKICEHFHLSLQSGCNQTLKRMNRRYTVEEFEEVVKLLRKEYPNVSLTTDIIVGFPGETEEEFQSTYKFLEKIKFYQMHVFKYSERKGTVAANMLGKVDPKIKEARSKILIELSKENEENVLKQNIGGRLEVLFEQKTGEYWIGHTKNYINVMCKDDIKENEIIEISAVSVVENNLVGAVIKA